MAMTCFLYGSMGANGEVHQKKRVNDGEKVENLFLEQALA